MDNIANCTEIDYDLNSDDMSVFSFVENVEEAGASGEDHDNVRFSGLRPCMETKTISVPFKVDDGFAAPVSDEEESLSDNSLFSDISFHPVADDKEGIPSMEALVAKLNRSMLRSARSRAMVSKTVFPDLRKRGTNRRVNTTPVDSPSSSIKTILHRGPRMICKTPSSSICIAQCDAMKIDGNSIGDFLRQTKRW
ncbi:unnamed protein product [Cylindrotheca closterium]|uniref:Uncharacterized protein n=1 Tax=Cylindrotheca closterium TaxID=2856 RepID=A0AAD2G4Z3_9STRA|nr:unnamed protein product [Cylindrotheca closterium]